MTIVNGQRIGNQNGDGCIAIPSDPACGLKIDVNSPAYGWRDITSDITVRGTGSNDPAWATFRTNINSYQFAVNDECWIDFHIPHDYVPGSELYIHAHWGVNSAVTANSLTWSFDATYSKRNDTTPPVFAATINKTVSHDASAVNLAQYCHVVSEVQLTTSGALTGQDIEVDGIILTRASLSANTLGTNPFLFFIDIHYQSNNMATKNKAPNFYA